MPVFIHLANLVIPKSIVEKKYPGGVNQFRKEYKIDKENYHQEDGELFSLAAMNSSEFDIVDLIETGISYDSKTNFSEDFTIIHRYGGAEWEPSWLRHNSVFVWHKDCNPEKIKKAEEIANITMDKIAEAFDRGEKPWETIS